LVFLLVLVLEEAGVGAPLVGGRDLGGDDRGMGRPKDLLVKIEALEEQILQGFLLVQV